MLDDIRQAVSDQGDLDDLLFLGDLTVGDLIDAGVDLNRELTLGEIEPVLGFVTVKALEDTLGIQVDLGSRLLGDLSDEELDFLTLNDLLALTKDLSDDLLLDDLSLGDLLIQLELDGALSGFTLGDLLQALVDPASLTYGGIEFAEVDVAALPTGTVAASTFSAAFTMTASTARPVQLEVALPTSAGFVPGSATVNGVMSDPLLDGRTLTWTVPAEPAPASYEVEFDVLPSLRLGATSLNAHRPHRRHWRGGPRLGPGDRRRRSRTQRLPARGRRCRRGLRVPDLHLEPGRLRRLRHRRPRERRARRRTLQPRRRPRLRPVGRGPARHTVGSADRRERRGGDHADHRSRRHGRRLRSRATTSPNSTRSSPRPDSSVCRS